MTADLKKNAVGQKNSITEGVIWKQLLLFFFPILFGTFIQQLYNTADAIIVGQFVGKEALSAVGGSTGMLTSLIVGFFVGLSSGASVLVSQYYGAKRPEEVRLAVHTSVAFCIGIGVVTMVVGIALTPLMLTAMGTPEDVLDMSIVYLRVYFLGLTFNLLYNIGASILRAAGDSKRPLYILTASCGANIVLDLLLVIGFRLGVLGAALATILSQAVSAWLVLRCLRKTDDSYHLEWKQVKIERQMLLRIVRIGIPAGFQSVMYGLSNVIVQAGINSLGTDTVAAWAAYSKIDSLYWLMISSFGIAVTTFAGQNYGANKIKRVRGGVRWCMGMALVSSALVSAALYLWGIYCFYLFTGDKEVIRIGIDMMHYMVPMYSFYVPIEVLSGALRGIGDCLMPMLLCLFGVCVIRIAWILFAVPLKRDMFTIMFSFPLTWVITMVLFLVYYVFFSRLSKRKRG